MSSFTQVLPDDQSTFTLDRAGIVGHLTATYGLAEVSPGAPDLELENDEMWVYMIMPRGEVQSVALQTRSYRDDLSERFPVSVFLGILWCLQGFDHKRELAVITPDGGETLFNADTTVRELHQICEASA
jgi:hypothetical protein